MTKSVEDILREVNGSAPSGPPAQRRGGKVGRAGARVSQSSSLLVVAAVLLVALIGSLPFGSYALYPFALLVTLIHETSHAFVAVATGGSVDQVKVSPDLSGVTFTSGGLRALISSAGYLGATAAGVALLLTPLKYSRYALGALVLLPLAALLAFHPGDAFTALWCLAFIGGLGAAAWLLPVRIAGLLQMFLGVEAALNAFRDLMTLLFLSTSNSHLQTDAKHMSGELFLPPAFWAGLWTVLSLALLASAILILARRDLRRTNA